MQQLTDFKPLAQVALPGLGVLDCSGLILIVGPNSSGKSQFLQDLHQRIRGEPRSLVVANEITIRKPDRLDLFLECLQREGYLVRVRDPNGQEQFRPLTTFVGTGEAAQPITPSQPQQWFDSFKVGDPANAHRRIDFLTYFGRLVVTALFLERRLLSVNPVQMFDFETQAPQNDFHALFVDDSARSALLTEIRSTFSRTI